MKDINNDIKKINKKDEINQTNIKIIVIGEPGTGKTSYVNKWTKNIFNENSKTTIISEYGYKVNQLKGKFYKIQLWDIAGQDKCSNITKTFAKNSHGSIVVCDATNTSTREK